MNRFLIVCATLGLMAGVPTPARGVDVGDKAPPLIIDEWVKGKPFDLKAQRGKSIVMVEFWATWCPPCKASIPRLTQFQRQYKKDLIIVGVTQLDSRGNSRTAVKRFVKGQGDEMDYHVAIDRGESTMFTYLGNAAAVTIPHAFLVGRDGIVLWQGSPLDLELDRVLPGIIAGTYDLESAKVEAEVLRRFDELSFSLQRGQWARVWDGLIGILKLDPTNETAMDLIMRIYVDQTRDTDAFRAWVASHMAANRRDTLAMRRLATTLCNIEDLARREPDLALEAAKTAYEASDQRDLEAVAVFARVMYQIGSLERAIELQGDAVALADGPDQEIAEGVLAFYTRCKKLRERVQ